MGNTSAHQELKEKAQVTVRQAISRFRWSNYGLDEVEDADPEWKGDLALHITEAVFGKDLK